MMSKVRGKFVDMLENHNKKGIHVESLRSEYKEALDLNMKTSVKSFPENIEFKP